MSSKSQQLQIRVTPEQKAALRRLARRAGQGMSAYVLSRILPPAAARWNRLLRELEKQQEPRFALAALHDLLAELSPADFGDAVADPPPGRLSPYLANYVAAMVEHAAHQKQVAAPPWVGQVEPLDRPHFAAKLASLRLHLLRSSPVAFRRRNLFVDSAVGDRV